MRVGVAEIQILAKGAGTRVVPTISDYDDSSTGWTEAEHRASVPVGAIAGFWEGEPGWVRIDDWPYTEVCVILSGSVAIEDVTGARREFGPGESFVVPKGFTGIWRTLTPCEKVFVGIDGPAIEATAREGRAQ